MAQASEQYGQNDVLITVLAWTIKLGPSRHPFSEALFFPTGPIIKKWFFTSGFWSNKLCCVNSSHWTGAHTYAKHTKAAIGWFACFKSTPSMLVSLCVWCSVINHHGSLCERDGHQACNCNGLNGLDGCLVHWPLNSHVIIIESNRVITHLPPTDRPTCIHTSLIHFSPLDFICLIFSKHHHHSGTCDTNQPLTDHGGTLTAQAFTGGNGPIHGLV